MDFAILPKNRLEQQKCTQKIPPKSSRQTEGKSSKATRSKDTSARIRGTQTKITQIHRMRVCVVVIDKGLKIAYSSDLTQCFSYSPFVWAKLINHLFAGAKKNNPTRSDRECVCVARVLPKSMCVWVCAHRFAWRRLLINARRCAKRRAKNRRKSE